MALPGKIAVDEDHPRSRSRLHQQQVADILNSLILNGQLVRLGNGVWQLVPASPASNGGYFVKAFFTGQYFTGQFFK